MGELEDKKLGLFSESLASEPLMLFLRFADGLVPGVLCRGKGGRKGLATGCAQNCWSK